MRGLILLLALVATGTASCVRDAGDIGSPASRRPEAKLTLVSGGAQTAIIGSSLPEPIRVRLDTAGVPAQLQYLEFVFRAYGSPGPNDYWYATTDAAGLASVNGIIDNAVPGPATITVNYTVCVVPDFKSCGREETRATVVIPVQVMR